MAELADALHSKCSIERCVGSSPTSGTSSKQSTPVPGPGCFVLLRPVRAGWNRLKPRQPEEEKPAVFHRFQVVPASYVIFRRDVAFGFEDA